jgi:hypothetical protein
MGEPARQALKGWRTHFYCFIAKGFEARIQICGLTCKVFGVLAGWREVQQVDGALRGSTTKRRA